MTFVPQSRVVPRAFWRPAIFLLVVSQVFLAFAPVIEGRDGPDARSHVEVTGTRLHHAHNEASCAACTARGLLTSANLQSSRDFSFRRAPAQLNRAAAPFVESAWRVQSRSRAPPVL